MEPCRAVERKGTEWEVGGTGPSCPPAQGCERESQDILVQHLTSLCLVSGF